MTRRSEARAGRQKPPASPPGGRRIALGVTGGIAAYKSAEIVRGLVRRGCEVHVLMTAHACRFITPLTLQTLSGHPVLTDQWDLSHGPDIQHITLAHSLDLFLVAPATADILAKFAHGIADDLLSTFYLAVTAPAFVAPAMNLTMWEHPATRDNLQVLRGRGVRVIDPEPGELACGEQGVGRMADPDAILGVLFGAPAPGGLKKKARGRSGLRVAGSS